MLIGWFLYIPLVIVPIIIVSVLLFSLRKMTARAVCIMNLIIASGAFLIFIMGEAGCHSALSSAPPRLHHGPITIREVVIDSVVLFWFAGAVGLFFRKRLAWAGSMIGVGASIISLAVGLGTIIGIYLYPNVGMDQLREYGAAGYIFTFVVAVTQISLLLAICLRLLWGLFQMRKELSAAS